MSDVYIEPEEQVETMKGQAFLFSETGTEGGLFAFNDAATVKVNEWGETNWSYDGLHVLRDGDYLKVLGERWAAKWMDNGVEYPHESGYNVLWEGEIK